MVNRTSKSKTGKGAVGKAINSAKALKLRLKGLNYREIGREIGVSHPQAYRYVIECLDQIREEMKETAEQVLMLELERLDGLTSTFYPKAIDGDIDAAGTVLRVMQRRAKLLGLDAPTKTEARVDQTLSHDAHREEMRLVLEDPEARAAMDAYQDTLRAARERAKARAEATAMQ